MQNAKIDLLNSYTIVSLISSLKNSKIIPNSSTNDAHINYIVTLQQKKIKREINFCVGNSLKKLKYSGNK